MRSRTNSEPLMSMNSQRNSWRTYWSPRLVRARSRKAGEMRAHSVAGTLSFSK